ncbi:hypothetical protein [Tenacibaculum larymnensis]|uniref:ATP-grasp domain-containing protein n=1 Tax=Tenacibaculum larymnensis TaxID=2878201 RepID=A0A9X4ER64_9FLAO|nr:hypothetical protein [Tenacibaculum larymnensis]MDE1207110.1 hypothetical protein [Tenacibaculum larymnensis]
MTINKSISILSSKHNSFIESKRKLIAPRVNTDLKEIDPVFREYEYPVCSWPVLIESDVVQSLEEMCLKIPKLLSQVPELYFKNDVSKIAEFYYDKNYMLAEFGLMCYQKKLSTSSRLDLTRTSDGFKILEVNMGPSLGGFQVQSFEKVIRSLHNNLLQDSSNKYHCRNIQTSYFKFLVGEILKHVSEIDKKNEINIFVGMDSVGEDLTFNTMNFFNNLWEGEINSIGLKGKAITGNLTDLQYVKGNIFYKNNRIHALTLLNSDLHLKPEVFRAYVLNSLYITSPIDIQMVEDKRNLAILRSLAEEKEFTDDENKLILDSIPYTEIVENKNVFYKGKEVNLLQLLKKNKNNFVVKDATGSQGKNVFVGKFMTIKEWDEAINYAVKNTKYIVQEFCDSIDFIAPNFQNEWSKHKLVWGAFGFGDIYGGVWVRMSEVKTDVGVINSAKGAVEAIVLETSV